MALSEFSFSLEFIPGVDNDIADSLSRLCRNNMIDSPKEYSPEYILSALHIESYEPDIFYLSLWLEFTILCTNGSDFFFTIRTDHRNLLFITEASNPMIVRW